MASAPEPDDVWARGLAAGPVLARARRVLSLRNRTAAVATVAALVATTLLAAGAARAETYKWIDAQGRVQYTDRLPPEAVNRGSVELSKQGMTKKVVEPPLSETQQQALEQLRERERQAEREVARQRQQENALLSSYTTETDIDVAKRRNLAIVGAAILGAEARIKALQRRLLALDKEKQFYENKPLPEKLKREIASINAEIPRTQSLITEKNIEAMGVINRYDAQKTRFRELKEQMARDNAKKRPVAGN